MFERKRKRGLYYGEWSPEKHGARPDDGRPYSMGLAERIEALKSGKNIWAHCGICEGNCLCIGGIDPNPIPGGWRRDGERLVCDECVKKTTNTGLPTCPECGHHEEEYAHGHDGHEETYTCSGCGKDYLCAMFTEVTFSSRRIPE